MLYRIVAKFGPRDGERRINYLTWRGLPHLTRFDSVDNILRPSLFEPETDQDWRYCVSEDFKIDLITDLGYALSLLPRYDTAEIVGLELDVDHQHTPAAHFLGYDIIDGYCGVSLLTDWGRDEERMVSADIQANGLLGDLGKALALRDHLREAFPTDSHAEKCSVWAIYRVDT